MHASALCVRCTCCVATMIIQEIGNNYRCNMDELITAVLPAFQK